MIRTQVYLPEDLYQQLKLLAKQENTNFSQLIREGVNEVVDKKRKKRHIGVDTLLALAQIGKNYQIKTPRDLASKIDYYLYGQGSREWGHLYRDKKKKT